MALPMEMVEDAKVEKTFHESPFTQPAATTQHESFATIDMPAGDHAFAYPATQYDMGLAVPMQETVSAPACFPPTDAMSLYVANGYAF